MDVLIKYLPFILILGVLYIMMRRGGGCCGSNSNSHHDSQKHDNTNKESKSCH